MTKPRTSIARELYGIIGKLPNASGVQRAWNAYFAEQGIDAFMDRYPTTGKNLPERLSEMFHFDRRLYLVGEDLQEDIVPLLDALDNSAKKAGQVNLVKNEGGVFTGYYISTDLDDVKTIR